MCEDQDFRISGVFFLFDGGQFRDSRNVHLNREFAGVAVQYIAGKELDSQVKVSLTATKRGTVLWHHEQNDEFLLEEEGELWLRIRKPEAIYALNANTRCTMSIKIISKDTSQEASLDWGFATREFITPADGFNAESSRIHSIINMELLGVLPGSATIDKTEDGGALSTAHRFYPTTPRHSSIPEAVANLKAARQPVLTILGHGSPGRMIVGGGETGNYANTVVLVGNRSFWQPVFGELSLTQLMYLYSCSVGAKRSGALLLHFIAAAVGGNVTAPTGLLFIKKANGDFYLEDGARWQTATPSMIPAPIDPPSYNIFSMNFNGKSLRAMKFAGFSIEEIVKVAVTVEHSSGSITSYLFGVDATDLLRFVAFTSAYEVPGDPLAARTAIWKFYLVDGTIRQFSLLADTLLRDDDDAGTFFRVDPLVEQVLRP